MNPGFLTSSLKKPCLWEIDAKKLSIEAVARQLLKQSTLISQGIIDIVSMTWEEFDSNEQEIILEKLPSDSNQRLWEEWRPE